MNIPNFHVKVILPTNHYPFSLAPTVILTRRKVLAYSFTDQLILSGMCREGSIVTGQVYTVGFSVPIAHHLRSSSQRVMRRP